MLPLFQGTSPAAYSFYPLQGSSSLLADSGYASKKRQQTAVAEATNIYFVVGKNSDKTNQVINLH